MPHSAFSAFDAARSPLLTVDVAIVTSCFVDQGDCIANQGHTTPATRVTD